MSRMSSSHRIPSTRTITYSRRKTVKHPPKAPAVDENVPTAIQNDAPSRSFWDFQGSSDEDEPATKTQVPSKEVTKVTPMNILKRKPSAIAEASVLKKAVVGMEARSRSSTPLRQSPTLEKKELGSEQKLIPRKSNLVTRNTMRTASPVAMKTSQKPSQPPSTPPRATTPKPIPTLQTSASPKTSPQQSNTPTKRTFSRVNSSPLSTPPSSSRNSNSQPVATTPTPRPTSRLGTRSRTFSDFPSPQMTPKQEKIWESLPLVDEGSPSRRRLVDKLREEASRTPERARTPPITFQPPLSQPNSLPSTTSFEDEISRILDYKVPIAEESVPQKENSQSESQGTYLSRSRSFLAEPSKEGSLDFDMLDDLWQPRESQVVEEEEEELGVKSWHELKRGGEDKRLLDEMEDLIEECKAVGRIGPRRSSVLQIVEKLLNDINWRRKFKALGLMSTFVHHVADATSDPILLLTTLLAISLVPKPVPPTVAAEVLNLCLAGLRERRDLITLSSLRSLGLSKILKNELLSLQAQISTSQILPEILTTRGLALSVLVDLSVPDIRPICAFLRDFEDVDPWEILVSIDGALEKSTQGKLVTGLEDRDIQVFNPILQNGISGFDANATLRKATLSAFRVCINLTNSSGYICESLNTHLSLSTMLVKVIASDLQRYSDSDYHDTASKDGSISSHEFQEIKESKFELLLLSLGLMINFIQESETVKDLVLSTHLGNDIKNVFEKLIDREVDILAAVTDLQEPANHALGYLALLFAHLIIPSHTGKVVVVEKTTRRWVERLLDDFVGIHKVVQSQSQEEGERKEVEGMAGEVEKVLRLLRAQ